MSDLNEQQKRAVEHTGNPLLIVAGAGTGKTTVITQKIAWLVEQNLAKTDEILALAFTEKAAGEMIERVDKILPYGYVDLWIMTFHGFAEKVLQQHGLDIGLPNNFKILNEFSQWALIKKNLDKFNLDYYRPLGNPTKFISSLIKHFSRAKDEDISPEQYLEYAQEIKQNLDVMLSGGDKSKKLNVKRKKDLKFIISDILDIEGEITKEIAEQEIMRINEVADAYHVYQQLLLENSALDFGDLINYTLKLFRERPAILAKYQEQFKYVLVDEFQDTNWSQYELIKLLKPKGENLTVVGDDDQSIFRFRGASMSNILQFKKDYADVGEVVLIENYRSKQNILDLAYDFIQLNNPNRLEVQLVESLQTAVDSKQINKKLIAQDGSKGVIEVIQGGDLHDEVNKVIEKIVELKTGDKDCTWNDFAILVRANNSAKEFVNALEIAGLPYVFLASKGLYSRPVIMDIIAYLKLLDNYHESIALYRVLNIPIFKFSHEEIINLINLAKKKTWSLYETLRNAVNFNEAISEKARVVAQLIEKHTALIRDKNVSEIITAFLQDSGYLKHLSDLPEQKSKEIMRELNQFMKRVKEFEIGTDEPSVKNFLAELDLEIESGEEGGLAPDTEAGPEMIKVLTVHAAKGLEFKYVFIVNMVDLRFPTTERKDPILLPDALVKEILPAGDVHLEEERRLFYVAMTRAKQGLYFSWAPDYGGQKKKRPSRFLVEVKVLESPKSEVRSPKSEPEVRIPAIRESKTVKYVLPFYYSYTQLAAYDNCPWQYRYAHILKIPRTGKAVFSFGQTMHSALQKFFGMVLQRENAKQGNLFNNHVAAMRALPLQDDLLKLYDESWLDDWYDSKEQKEEYRKKGREILKEFYNKHKDNWPKVLSTEQGIRFKIGNYTIFGKIDRVDGSNGEALSDPDVHRGRAGVRIVDYKTGSPKSENKISLDDKQQLLIYQMAAEQALNKKVDNLQFYYLDNNSEVNFLGSNDEINEMKEKLVDKIKNIENSIKEDNFPPKPSMLCQFCDFKNICEYRKL